MAIKNRPKDFFAKQIRSSHLIASGGIIDPSSNDLTGELENLRLMIYPSDVLETSGSYLEGAFEGIVPEILLKNDTGHEVGTDVWMFISGAQDGKDSGDGVVLFGGDVFISGTLYGPDGIISGGGGGGDFSPGVAIVDYEDATGISYENPAGDIEYRIELELISTKSLNYISVYCAEDQNFLLELPTAIDNAGMTYVIKDSDAQPNTKIKVAPKLGQSLDQHQGWYYEFTGDDVSVCEYIDGADGPVPLELEEDYASVTIWSDGTKWLIS